jgi:oryzin
MRLCNFLPVALSIAGFVAAKARIINADAANVVADSYIVVLKPGVATTEKEKHFTKVDTAGKKQRKGVGHKFKIDDFSGYQINIGAANLNSVLDDPIVAYVEKDVVISAAIPVPEPQRGTGEVKAEALLQQPATTTPWGLGRISHRQRATTTTPWPYIYDSTGGSGATVYVIDTGIRTTHAVCAPGHGKFPLRVAHFIGRHHAKCKMAIIAARY